MAILVYDPTVDPIEKSLNGLTFGKSKGGIVVRRRPSPVNHQTTPRMTNRAILSTAAKFFWPLTNDQKKAWMVWGNANGIVKPFAQGPYQLANAAFLTVEVNALTAGDPLYIIPPGNLPLPGVTFTDLTRIDKNTIRATFNPSPAGPSDRIFLRQTLPNPGFREWKIIDGYIAENSALNPTSPYDFTTHFQHLSGWNCRYWTGTQETTGRRSVETIWDL
ncbi:hypothetical protein LCGC14_1103450 [marine sediment metagenome]|uniref:Uncharacterized protein n=1 Tax=marine sediment metagenome TaxID=412755 RepID=A0A0F9QF33_9ZZZZ